MDRIGVNMIFDGSQDDYIAFENENNKKLVNLLDCLTSDKNNILFDQVLDNIVITDKITRMFFSFNKDIQNDYFVNKNYQGLDNLYLKLNNQIALRLQTEVSIFVQPIIFQKNLITYVDKYQIALSTIKNNKKEV